VSGELGAARDAMHGLRQDLLGQTLQTLAGQARADRELLQTGIAQSAAQLGAGIESLTRVVGERLEAITGHVNQRLDDGFRKTNETFASVMARLATIDEAQKKIDGLTQNVVSLQELLGDKRSRGAFGEVQLEGLVRNMLPPGSFDFQYTLPNGSRVDCVLRLPAPTGLVAVDSKFPLENYQRMFDPALGEADRRQAQLALRADVKRHVDDIARKYLIPDVTSDGAVMFVPAEAVFAEIHAYHPELVAYAQTRRVWIVSPTTLMAVLNTARAVLKDVETRKQIHLIKDALGKLAKDFARFDERMANLARHIDQANQDVQEVQVSGRKISAHFQRIEEARIDEIENRP
jgi:DNA recombination protein RmuC